MRHIDIIGNTYGRLTVVSRAENAKDAHARFNCVCSCGGTITTSSNSLRKGYTTSCGCYRKEFRKKQYDPAVGNEYSVYKRTARDNGREFSLTIGEFESIITAPCTYCGTQPNRKSRPKRITSDLLFNGIDRRDNSKGYTVENAQPCCTTCNLAKRTMSEDVFLAWVEKVYNFMKGKLNGS